MFEYQINRRKILEGKGVLLPQDYKNQTFRITLHSPTLVVLFLCALYASSMVSSFFGNGF